LNQVVFVPEKVSAAASLEQNTNNAKRVKQDTAMEFFIFITRRVGPRIPSVVTDKEHLEAAELSVPDLAALEIENPIVYLGCPSARSHALIRFQIRVSGAGTLLVHWNDRGLTSGKD
jgi:hypothetical protein